MKLYKIYSSMSDNYKNHQALKNLFPGECKVLYQKNGSSLLVLTDGKPSVEDDMLLEFIGDSDNYLKKISDSIAFTIRLNAVKANGRKKYPLHKHLIPQWVKDKLSKAGLELLEHNISNEGILVSERKGERCYHSSLYISGFAKIVDMDLFKKAVYNGIGHGKAFGFGMLNVFSGLC